MAAPLRQKAFLTCRLFTNLAKSECRIYDGHHHLTQLDIKLPPPSPIYHFVRWSSFISRSKPANRLWDGVTGLSAAGSKKGRGKRGTRRVNLNRGRFLGDGKANILWPGLNFAPTRGSQLVKQGKLPEDLNQMEKIQSIRDSMLKSSKKRRNIKKSPLQRGYTGDHIRGQSIGPPDPIGSYTFEGFDSRVIELKLVSNMTRTHGRKSRFSAFVVVGNGNGLAGYALGKSAKAQGALRMAKNNAAQRLQYIPRYDDHTVYHNAHMKFHRTKIFVQKKEAGHGLKAHRVIRTVAQLMGLRDLYCKVENSTTNYQSVTKGFFEIVTTQETHQDLADRIKLHVVEMKKEQEDLPVIVASPSEGIVSEEEITNERKDPEVSFERLYMGGKVRYQPPKKAFYANYKSHKRKEHRLSKMRGQRETNLLRLAGLA